MEEFIINHISSNYSNANSKRTPDDRSSGLLVNINKNEFLLFGGGNREKTFNDFWHLKILNNNSYEWQEIKLISDVNITNRFGMVGALNTCSIDENILNLYIHGGQNYFEEKHYADMLIVKIKVSKDEQLPSITEIKNLTKYPLDISNTPRERNSHSIVSVLENNNQRFYLFGGGSNQGLLNDLWKYDPADNKWFRCELKGEFISPREMHGMINYINKKKENFLYILGGRLYENVDNKLYKINLKENSVEFVCELVMNLPISLCSFSYIGYKNYFILYGGTDGITFLNEIIILNIANQKIAKSKFLINTEQVNNDPNLTPFLGRIGSMMAIDEKSELLIIFGGSSLHKDTNFINIFSLKDLLDENNLVPFN